MANLKDTILKHFVSIREFVENMAIGLMDYSTVFASIFFAFLNFIFCPILIRQSSAHFLHPIYPFGASKFILITKKKKGRT